MRPVFFRRKLFHAPLWVAVLATLAGCADDRPPVNVEGLTLPQDHREVNWMKVLDELPLDKNRAKALAHLHEADSVFWMEWCEGILQLGPASDTSTVDVLRLFLEQMEPMMSAIDTTSGDARVLEREAQRLNEGFLRLLAMDPAARVPDVIWMPSGFNFAVYPGDGWLGVGLDWFMGSNHPMHAELPPSRFPAYRLARMRPDWMATEAMKGWLLVENQHRIPGGTRTVDMWLYWGKIMHVLSRAFPESSPAELMSWTEDEWAWAVEHERSAWAEMQPQDRMFATSPREVMRWFQEGPFTRVGRIPQDSPDRLGIFLGWRAMEAAWEAHPEWTDLDVLELTDPQPVLRSYRP